MWLFSFACRRRPKKKKIQKLKLEPVWASNKSTTRQVGANCYGIGRARAAVSVSHCSRGAERSVPIHSLRITNSLLVSAFIPCEFGKKKCIADRE